MDNDVAPSHPSDQAGLSGAKLLAACLAIGMGNFLVVLDTTIANVSVPTIAGGLGVSPTQGTWVITAYAVAEAITVPLTGFLSKRFGAMRLFIACYLAFAVVSLFCGVANSMSALIAGRVLLGLVGGPIMPLSQLLLLRVAPKNMVTPVTILWAMTTLVAPVVGPILGGIICDDYGWPWIFYIKVPIALAGGLATLMLLRGQPDPTEQARIDTMGLGLLVLWVGALQIMLDEGRNHDWFAAGEIRWLAVISVISFVAFLIWELTEKHPIVDLRIFRYRGFTAAAVTYAVGFGAFFGTIVLLPLWLQQNMGYTATWAGYATGMMGILAVACAPLVGKAVQHVDPRLIIFLGIIGIGLSNVWRMGFNSDVTFIQIGLTTLVMGPFMVMFFVPVTGLAMASVAPEEQANAAGLSNFMRTLSGAFATSLVQTGWSNAMRADNTELASAMKYGEQTIDEMVSHEVPYDRAVAGLDMMVQGQSLMLATLHMFAVLALAFAFAALLIWIAPRPKGPIDTSGAH